MDQTRPVEDSPFVRLLDREGRVKTIDVLLRKPHSKLTADEIAELAGIEPSTFHRNKDVLEELNIVQSETVGNTSQYTINTDNEIAKTLAKTHTKLLKYGGEIIESTTEFPEEKFKHSVLDSEQEEEEPEDSWNPTDLAAKVT